MFASNAEDTQNFSNFLPLREPMPTVPQPFDANSPRTVGKRVLAHKMLQFVDPNLESPQRKKQAKEDIVFLNKQLCELNHSYQPVYNFYGQQDRAMALPGTLPDFTTPNQAIPL